jgi:hypothetical protein
MDRPINHGSVKKKVAVNILTPPAGSVGDVLATHALSTFAQTFGLSPLDTFDTVGWGSLVGKFKCQSINYGSGIIYGLTTISYGPTHKLCVGKFMVPSTTS